MSARGVSSESESESDESEAGLAAVTADFFAGAPCPPRRAPSISAIVGGGARGLLRWGLRRRRLAGDVAATGSG